MPKLAVSDHRMLAIAVSCPSEPPLARVAIPVPGKKYRDLVTLHIHTIVTTVDISQHSLRQYRYIHAQ